MISRRWWDDPATRADEFTPKPDPLGEFYNVLATLSAQPTITTVLAWPKPWRADRAMPRLGEFVGE